MSSSSSIMDCIAPCLHELLPFVHENPPVLMVPVISIIALYNLVPIFNTKMYFWISIMVCIAICHHDLLPFVDVKWQFLLCMGSKSINFDQNLIKLIHNVMYGTKYIS